MNLRRLALCLSMLLAACGQQTPTASTPSWEPLPVPSHTPAVQTVSPTHVPSFNATALHAEPPPMLPTSLPAEPTPTATPSGWAMIEQGVEWGVSPDEQWIWALETGTTENDQQYHVTHIVSPDGRVEWRAQPDPQAVKRFSGAENGYRPFFWMPNEPYLFLVGEVCCWDGPVLFYSGIGLYRLNLETGQFSEIYPWGRLYHFSFSPSGKYLLSTYPGAHAVNITRLRDGRAVTIPLPESVEQAGDTRWSPDGKHLIMTACREVGDDICKEMPVILVDPDSSEFQTVISDARSTLGLSEYDYPETAWEDDQHILLIGQINTLVYELRSGKLSKR